MKMPPMPSSNRRRRAIPTPPRHLLVPERKMWTAIIRENELVDESSLALLRSALESHQRARTCREAVDRDGETFSDRFGQVKIHPLIGAERDARAGGGLYLPGDGFEMLGIGERADDEPLVLGDRLVGTGVMTPAEWEHAKRG